MISCNNTLFEDINWEVYHHVTAVVVQNTNHSEDDWYQREDRSAINHQLQKLPHMSYYPNGIITWLLKTSEYKAQDTSKDVVADTIF